jgi:DNA polymerase-3 subunit alpha
VAYQTAYLKAHYPAEYMSAVLNHAGSIDKITFFMEECKRMGIRVLGPDINESLEGFAVNEKGEIRFGLGGLKGVGEAAVQSIIEEREKSGRYQNIFEFIRRINQRTVNKRTLECLAFAGSFDCFPEYHRAQYFFIPEGETASGLERIIRYGNIINTQQRENENTLFGPLSPAEVPLPKIPDCAPWPLTVQLEREKEVAGIFLSGHPLDHYRFEQKHYSTSTIADFLEFRDQINQHSNPNRPFRLLALVTDAQHRIAKNGNKYGNFVIEDYTGKLDFPLFSEDYLRFTPLLQTGTIILVLGFLKQRYNRSEYEFKLQQVMLGESVKKTLTRELTIVAHPGSLKPEWIEFLNKNRKKNPGKTSLVFHLIDPEAKQQVTLRTLEKPLEMNDELLQFLADRQEWQIRVQSL